MATKRAKNKKREVDGFEHFRRTKHLLMTVGWQGDAATYHLPLKGRRKILEAFPDAAVNPGNLHLGMDKAANYQRYHQPYWPQIAMMLTGLKPEQIASLGGIEIYDPDNERVLWMWKPDVTSRSAEAIPPSGSGTAESPAPQASPGRRSAGG